MAAVAVFVGELKERGFAPPFGPSLRVHKLTGLDLCSLGFADGMRAVFRIAPPARKRPMSRPRIGFPLRATDQ